MKMLSASTVFSKCLQFIWSILRYCFPWWDREKLENTKEVIRNRKPKDRRKYNGQKKKDKWKNNVLQQNITQK